MATTVTSLRLPDELCERVDALAKATGRTKSYILIADYLAFSLAYGTLAALMRSSSWMKGNLSFPRWRSE